MANEIKDVKNVKVNLEKQKGIYDGEAIQGVLSAVPEGFGKIVFKNGDVMEGRFKNGNFVSGKVTTNDGIVLEGEFDNLKWLSGTVNYPNGDFLIGKLNTKTQKLELEKFRVTQNFDDVVEGTFFTQDDIMQAKGIQTFVDGSTFEGTFEIAEAKATNNVNEEQIVKTTTFGVQRPVFVCKQAKVKLNIFEDKQNKSNAISFVGDFDGENIVGTLTHKSENFEKTLTGTFEFERDNIYRKPHNSMSEDFGNFFDNFKPETPFSYHFNMKENGSIKIVDGTESFEATKFVDENDKIVYDGTFSSSKNKQNLQGEFFEDLSIKTAKANFETQTGKLVGTFNQTENGYSFNGEITFVNGDFKKGSFKSDLIFEKGENGTLKQVLNKNTFQSGTLRQTLKSPENTKTVFEGKTRDLITKEEDANYDITSKPSIFENLNKNLAFFGTLKTTVADDEPVNKRSGLFNLKFELLEGHIDERVKKDDATIWALGDKKLNAQKEYRFFGRTICKEREESFDGEFLEDYTFLKGKLQFNLPNRSVFTGQTEDLTHFSGKLERKNDFWQEGEFELESETDFVFKQGTTLVFFDRPDKAQCYARFDQNGFKDFDGKKYICKITTSKKRPIVDVFATNSISDAMTQFDHKIKNEKIAQETTQTKIQNIVSNVNTNQNTDNNQKKQKFGSTIKF